MTKGSNRTRAQRQFDALPWYLKAAQAADDIARFGANAVTLGYADNVAGYLNGQGTEAERRRTAEAMQRAGSAAIAAEAVGTMAPLAAVAATPLSATRAIPQTYSGAKGVGASLAALGVDATGLAWLQSAPPSLLGDSSVLALAPLLGRPARK